MIQPPKHYFRLCEHKDLQPKAAQPMKKHCWKIPLDTCLIHRTDLTQSVGWNRWVSCHMLSDLVQERENGWYHTCPRLCLSNNQVHGLIAGSSTGSSCDFYSLLLTNTLPIHSECRPFTIYHRGPQPDSSKMTTDLWVPLFGSVAPRPSVDHCGHMRAVERQDWSRYASILHWLWHSRF